ncbi:hypothetical protein QBC38DRAFT_465840 [Podospora fimiseda]|uniref:T6SS Phospholipase effector Tle1-like catalytic domain-containing protein n=1 Tax=Podospora fimiseda TaxID=252190 RepID=A0AAN7H573_9PEZI|nr:hypothetical protein QBC38DRAFT_465840 [Podospora fimiseda]
MISDIGLLTREGMEHFYMVFKDMKHWRDEDWEDPFPDEPFPNKPWGKGAPEMYRKMLVERKLSRINQNEGKGPLIKVRAVAVFDTVGSLGIPNVSFLNHMGLAKSTKEFRLYDTNLSDRIEYAFHALALDEHRPPFAPTVWERTAKNKNTTDLRQVWFPGNHGNVGGGWEDAGMANMSLAWMMDQLASIGVEFDEASIARMIAHLEKTYHKLAEKEDVKLPHPVNKQPRPVGNLEAAAILSGVNPDAGEKAGSESSDGEDGRGCCPGGCCSGLGSKVKSLLFSQKQLHWGVEPFCENSVPVRPWALGALLDTESWMYKLAGHDIRSPGTYKKLDPMTGRETKVFLEDTNERMHSSVRVRLALKGLGLNDQEEWKAPALQGNWRLRKTTVKIVDPIPSSIATWEPVGLIDSVHTSVNKGLKNMLGVYGGGTDAASINTSQAPTTVDIIVEQQRPLEIDAKKGYRWVWEWCGSMKDAPPQRLIVEEPLGPFERQLLRLTGGVPNVYEYAETVKNMDGRKI